MEVSRGDGSVIAVEVAGEQDARPVLFCHGLADSRLSAQLFGPAARELGLRLMAPDRPGIGRTDPRGLGRLADWAEDAALVLDAAAPGRRRCWASRRAGRSPRRARPGLAAASAASRSSRRSARQDGPPAGWRRGNGSRCRPRGALRPSAAGFWAAWPCWPAAARLFLRLATSELPGIDRRALEQPGLREAFLAGYAEAFRQGSRGVAQDLRVLIRPWGFELGSIKVPASIHHGDADTTVPAQHARLFAEAIPGAQLQLHPGHGHFSILGAARQMLAPLAA